MSGPYAGPPNKRNGHNDEATTEHTAEGPATGKRHANGRLQPTAGSDEHLVDTEMDTEMESSPTGGGMDMLRGGDASISGLQRQESGRKRKADHGDDKGTHDSLKRARRHSLQDDKPRRQSTDRGSTNSTEAPERNGASNRTDNGPNLEDGDKQSIESDNVDRGVKGTNTAAEQDEWTDRNSRRATGSRSPRPDSRGAHNGHGTEAEEDRPKSSSQEDREPPRRVTSPSVLKEEERRRGKRLFGGLMSTLNKSGQGSVSHTQQKRRQETEARMAEKARERQQEEMRLAEQRTEDRRKDQAEFEERVMKKKHDILLDQARFLKTKTQPPIYWLPKRLLRSQRENIEDQIDEAHNIIDREVEQFEARKHGRGPRHGHKTYERRGPRRPSHPEDVDMDGNDRGYTIDVTGRANGDGREQKDRMSYDRRGYRGSNKDREYAGHHPRGNRHQSYGDAAFQNDARGRQKFGNNSRDNDGYSNRRGGGYDEGRANQGGGDEMDLDDEGDSRGYNKSHQGRERESGGGSKDFEGRGNDSREDYREDGGQGEHGSYGQRQDYGGRGGRSQRGGFGGQTGYGYRGAHRGSRDDGGPRARHGSRDREDGDGHDDYSSRGGPYGGRYDEPGRDERMWSRQPSGQKVHGEYDARQFHRHEDTRIPNAHRPSSRSRSPEARPGSESREHHKREAQGGLPRAVLAKAESAVDRQTAFDREQDEHGDVVVEADEDTVIY